MAETYTSGLFSKRVRNSSTVIRKAVSERRSQWTIKSSRPSAPPPTSKCPSTPSTKGRPSESCIHGEGWKNACVVCRDTTSSPS